MSTDHLRWHLLREINQIALEKIRHQDDFYRCLHWQDYNPSNNPALPKLAYLCSLFLSGKEPAAAVDFVLSQGLSISGNGFEVIGKLCREKFNNRSQSVHLRNLALRLTRFLTIETYKDFSDSGKIITVTSFVQTLRDGNCVEELSMMTSENPFIDVAIVEACPNLSTLICSQKLLDFLLKCSKTPFSKLRAMKTHSIDYNWSRIFKKLTKRPELFPSLETLTSSVKRSDLKALSLSAHTYIIPTVTSYNVTTGIDYSDPIDFQFITSLQQMFPKLKTASVTAHAMYEDVDPKLCEVFDSFKKYDSNVDFTFNYIVDHTAILFSYSKTQVDELETQLRSLGTITSVSVAPEEIKYVVTSSYPNKTMVLKLTIQIDNDGSEAEGSEGNNG